MSIRAHVKRNARNALAGKYGTGMAIILVVFSIYVFLNLFEQVCFAFFQLQGIITETVQGSAEFVINTSVPVLVLTFGPMVLYYLITTPLIYGLKLWAYSVAQGNQATIATSLYFYQKISQIGKTLYLRINVGVRLLFWWVVCNIPAIASTWALFAVYDLGQGTIYLIHIALILLSLALYIVGSAFTVFATAQYFLTPYLFYENVELPVGKIVKTSREYMKGYRTQVFSLHLSFLHMYILNLFIMPIIFTAPYIEVTKGIFAKYIIDCGRMENTGLSHTMEIVL